METRSKSTTQNEGGLPEEKTKKPATRAKATRNIFEGGSKKTQPKQKDFLLSQEGDPHEIKFEEEALELIQTKLDE